MHALSDAWLELADSLIEGSKQELRNLRRQRASDDEELSRGAMQKLASLEHQLKLTLQDQIYTRELKAFGVDITLSIDEPEKPIPAALFNFQGDIDIRWDSSEIAVAGKRIIGVKVAVPNQEGAALANERTEPTKNKGGRPRVIDYIQHACWQAMSKNANFCSGTVKARIYEVEEILRTDKQAPASLKNGIKEETFRRARKAVCQDCRNLKTSE